MTGRKVCAITECRAQLLGMNYFGVELDDGRVVALCPRCMRKVRKARKDLTA